MNKSIWLGVIGFVAAATGFWLSTHLTREPAAPVIAPALTLNDLNGKPHTLTDWRGKLLLVNFWATWCAPCIDEIPLLVQAQKEYGPRGLQIIGPAMDEITSITPMAARLGINYPLMADFAQVDTAMRLLGNEHGGLPYSVLISHDGLIVKTILGGVKKDELQRLIETHLKPTGTTS